MISQGIVLPHAEDQGLATQSELHWSGEASTSRVTNSQLGHTIAAVHLNGHPGDNRVNSNYIPKGEA